MSSIFLSILLLPAAPGCESNEQRDAIERLGDASHVVRLHAAAELGERRVATIAAVHALSVALGDPDEMVRFYAADSLGRIGEDAKVAEGAMLLALGDESWIVRRKVALALGSIQTKELVFLKRLRRLYPDENDRPHAHLVLLYYAQDPPPRAEPYAAVDLSDKDWDVRLRALRYFFPRRDPDHAQSLCHMLSDEHVAVRVMAEHLFFTGNRDAQNALMFQRASRGGWRPWNLHRFIDGVRVEDIYSSSVVRQLYGLDDDEVRSSLLALIKRRQWDDDETIRFLKQMATSDYGSHRARALRLLDERMQSGL